MDGCWMASVRARTLWVAALVGVLALFLTALPSAAQGPIEGFDPRCIEIDSGANGANVSTDPGPTNDTPSCGNVFIDWADFGAALASHTITDGVGNADPDIVGPGNKLVSGSTLPKQDIYNLFISNNAEYLYLAMARRSNNGNSTYHWFFTKAEPTVVPGEPIVFNLQNGDTELRVCFPKGSAPEDFSAEIYQVSGLGPGAMISVEAADIWSTVSLVANPAAMAAFSLNAVDTAALPGALDSHGDPSSVYEKATFAEGAADLSVLGIEPCGATAYVTVMTRSSCSLTSDLKDISPPVEYHFGTVSLSAGSPTVACSTAAGATVTITATASGGSGEFDWTWPAGWSHVESAGTTVSVGTGLVPVGAHQVCVTADDHNVPDCHATACTTVNVPAPVSLTLEILSGLDCVSSVDLKATAAGGDGDYTYTWKVDGSTVLVDPQSSGGPSFYTLVFPDDEYCGARTVTVHVMDSRGCANPAPDPSEALTKATAITRG